MDISDEVPFDLPEAWAWCRFASIVNYRIGKPPGLLTICIENLAAKWLLKVVGRWTGRIPLSGEVENHLPRQCAPHVAERLILMAGSGSLPLPPLYEQHRICAKIHDTFELLR